MNTVRDASLTTRRRKMAILNGWHNQTLASTPQRASTKPEQTSQVSGEIVTLRRLGCCAQYPNNEPNPGGNTKSIF